MPASRYTNGSLRLLRGSRCDRTGFNADIQNWVATLAIHLSLPKKLDEKVSKLQLIVLSAVLTVFAQEHADYIGVKVEGSRLGITAIETQDSAEGVVAGSGFGASGDFDKLSADRARAGGTSHEKVPRHCQLMD